MNIMHQYNIPIFQILHYTVNRALRVPCLPVQCIYIPENHWHAHIRLYRIIGDIADLTLEELREFSDVITEDVYDVLTLEGSVAARNHVGGTAPAQVRLQVARWEKIFAEREAQAKALK